MNRATARPVLTALALAIATILLHHGLAAEIPSGLVAHYPLDKDASDASGKGHHATSHGAKPAAEGKLGGAFAFDGSSTFVTIPAGVTHGLSEFTLALWAKTGQSKAAPRKEFWRNPTLLGVATAAPGSRDLAIVAEDGRVAYHHGLKEGRDTCFFTDARIADDKWHHLAITNGGSRILFYVDGRLAKGEATTGSGPPVPAWQTAAGEALGDAGLFVGACNNTAEPGPAEHFFHGLIDDVRVWNRALGPKEIAALWTQVTGQEVAVIEPPAPLGKPQPLGPAIASATLKSRAGLRWVLDQRQTGWALGTLFLNGKPLEAPVRSGVLGLRNVATGEALWLPAAKCEPLDERSARLTGSAKVGEVTLSFEAVAALHADLPAATLDASWAVDKPLDGWEVCLAWQEGFDHSWFCHLYPFAENAKAVSRQPLAYVGVPAALLCREDISAATIFGIATASDYLNPTTWTGTTGFHFKDKAVPPQFRFGGGKLSPGIQYHVPLQLIVSDAGDSLRAVAQLVRAWIKLNDYKVEPLHVRTPDEALAIYLEGRRKTDAWKPGMGYVLQPGHWNAIYLGTTPASAWFEYRIFELSGDKLWRQRAIEQMDFTLKAQDADPASRHFSAMHTAYDLGKKAFDSDDRGRNRGYKPDLIAHMARYMLLTWKRLKECEGIDRKDWHEAAVRAADWVLKQRNDDGGLPQKVDCATGAKSNSVVSARALAALPVIAAVTGDKRYLDAAETMERFVREKVEGRLWFTGQHPDLPPNDLEADSIWGVIEYWLDKHERTRDKECLDRATADALLALLSWCPKQLSWVKNPSQCAHNEQQNYLQYSLYCYHNRKLECLWRLAKATGDPLFAALYERVLQCVFYTQETKGNLMGAMHESICDPWRARGGGFDNMGTLYMNELSLDAMLQLVDMGIAKPRGGK